MKAAARHTLDGAILVVLAEALLLPAGLVIAGVLTRRLAADGYGLFSLTMSTVAWVEWTLVSLFSRATIKLVSDADDWRPLGAAVLRAMGLTGLAAGALMWALAEPLATAMAEPRLAGLVRLLALDIPIFCAAQAHRQILIGLGRYRQRALTSVVRWLGRMALIVLLVELGFGVEGAVVGSIVSTVIELAVQRLYVQPPLRQGTAVPLGQLWDYSVPLFVSAFALRYYDRLDLVALKLLGGTVAQAGLYGAAQRIALVPGTLALTFSPLLLSTASHLLRGGDTAGAARLGRHALRAVVVLMPLAAMGAGAAPEIVRLAFGPGFEAAAPLVVWLTAAVTAIMILSVAASLLIAHGRPWLLLALTGPLMPLAVVGHVLVIPRLGPPGAAGVTAAVSVVGALACLAAARQTTGLAIPAGTLARSLALSAAAFLAAAYWPMPGLLVLVKLAGLAAAVLAGFAALGEVSAAEFALARNYLRRPLAFAEGKIREARP